MPGKDGTGPLGQGPIGGAGTGLGRRGRMGANQGTGAGGYCVCPQCGEKAPHESGTPCSSVSCPKCGAKMIRDI